MSGDINITKTEVMQLIPHRDPFLFVDEAIISEDMNFCIGKRLVKADEPHFKGHFPAMQSVP